MIGVGGYSSGPVVLAGGAARHADAAARAERGAGPDQPAARARSCSAAAVTFESTRAFFGAKAFVSGNPVRPEFFATAGPTESARDGHADAARVLVFGGSQGAHAINVAMVEAAPQLAAGGRACAITHQTGERDRGDGPRRLPAAPGLQAEVEPFLYDMDRRDRTTADLIVCRAGATTLAEITAAGRAGDPRFRCRRRPTTTSARTPKRWRRAGAAELLMQTRR